jgi:hypothetical protein
MESVRRSLVHCHAAPLPCIASRGWIRSTDEYSIKKCISVINTMEELIGKEKGETFDVFKDAYNM